MLALAALSGAGTLGLQVLWTRAFSLVSESSVYAFALVVAVFLIGLAGGAGLARAALRRAVRPRRLLGTGWAIGGLLVVASPIVFTRLTHGLAYVQAASWPALVGRLASLAAVEVLPATLALGVALPALLEIAGEDRDSAGQATGALMAANTVGAIVGPIVVGFLVAPALGLWQSLALLGGLALFAGASVGFGRRGSVVGAVAAVAALVVVAQADPTPVRVRAERGERLVSVHEGSLGTTAVLEDPRDRWITVNNAYVLGGTAAAGEERWQAHLPLLLHPGGRVAFLGLGTGITAGASLLHPVDRVVLLEIVPEVVTAARESFAEANRHLLSDPRVSVIADDGRQYLAASSSRFDVIIGDLLVPWRTGEAELYTREHFETVRRALAPDGVFCQWLPVYQLSERQLAIVTATFLDVFPGTTLWRGNFLPDQPILALVGRRGNRPIDPERLDARVRALAPLLEGSHPFLQHPAGFWLFLLGAVSPSETWLAGARRNTDAWPWLEMLGPVAQAEGRSDRFLRGPLQAVLEDVAAQPLTGTALGGLDARHLGWRSTGLALARAAQDRGPDGEARTLALLRTLPAELQSALGVPQG